MLWGRDRKLLKNSTFSTSQRSISLTSSSIKYVSTNSKEISKLQRVESNLTLKIYSTSLDREIFQI
jgi:hypothetical protein